ncbi:hypothetical protein B0H16DRAFT_1729048 [Mycena metata]|uniref:Uncharacterized protein n=1 Tax=Mycena metata TaxID=1033252 RepID=A0AAD7IF83_9AGAR|nr:hypothetical protein B0H16DRAFT_1729048 [Mycena metata]
MSRGIYAYSIAIAMTGESFIVSWSTLERAPPAFQTWRAGALFRVPRLTDLQMSQLRARLFTQHAPFSDNSSTRSSLTTSSTAHARNGGSRLFSLPSSAQGLASSASITLAVRAHAAQDGGPRQEVKRTFLTAGVDHIMTLLETGLSFAGARELMGSDLYSKLTDYSANHFKRSSRLVLSSHFSPGISHWATGAILSYCYCGTAPESDRRHALHRMRLEARLIMARRQGRAPDIRGRVVSRGYPIWALVAPDYYFFVCGDENRENASTLHDEPPPSATNTPPNGTATSSAPATRLFTYLNRYWVKRQRDEGKKAVYQVYTLALIQWHPHLFHRLIHPQRNGGTIDQTLAKKIINSAEATAFKFLNGTEGAAATTGEGAVPPAGGESLGGTGNIPEYLKKAEGRLNEDNEQSNLNPKTPYYPVSSSSVPSTRYPVGLRLTLPLATARPAHPRAHTPPVHRRINTIRFVAGIAESGVGPSAGAYPTTPGKRGIWEQETCDAVHNKAATLWERKFPLMPVLWSQRRTAYGLGKHRTVFHCERWVDLRRRLKEDTPTWLGTDTDDDVEVIILVSRSAAMQILAVREAYVVNPI